MKARNVQSSKGVTLVGGGSVLPENLRIATAFAPTLIAADGGAHHCVSEGLTPTAVIGDLDSVNDTMRNTFPDTDFIHVSEQDSTDFEKSLTRINAPFVLATGFTAPRLDHTLAVFATMARRIGPPTLVLGEGDVIFAAPKNLTLNLPIGTRLSLFPLEPMKGQSTGLKWPINDLTLGPGNTIGTSNETTGPVSLSFDKPGCLILLPPQTFEAALHALVGPASVPGQ